MAHVDDAAANLPMDDRSGLQCSFDAGNGSEDDNGRAFHAVRPWVGNCAAPTGFTPNPELFEAPRFTLVLDHVYGYRSRQARCNAFYVEAAPPPPEGAAAVPSPPKGGGAPPGVAGKATPAPTPMAPRSSPALVVYHVAAVGVVFEVTRRTQRHYLGHDGEILCLDYHKESRMVATGGVSTRPNRDAAVAIWSVDTLQTRALVVGQGMKHAIVAVAFSGDGSRVFAIASDMQQRGDVAIIDVASGLVLCVTVGDCNRMVGCISDRTTGGTLAMRKSFVTFGVSHIKFWTYTKGALTAKKAIGGDIARQTMISAASSATLVFLGNYSGAVYIFADGNLIRSVLAHASFTCGMCCITENVTTGQFNAAATTTKSTSVAASSTATATTVLLTGGRDGLVKRWRVDDLAQTLELIGDVPMDSHSPVPAQLHNKAAPFPRGSNAPRTIHSVSIEGPMLVGTQLGSLYAVSADGTTVTPLVEGHYDTKPGAADELCGLAVHPAEPLFATTGDDATLRLWSVELKSPILIADVVYGSRCIAYSPDGGSLAVGHVNGAFSVWDAVTLTPTHPFTRRRREPCSEISYAPNGLVLAVAMRESKVVDLYDAKRGYIALRECFAESGMVRSLDWNALSTILRVCTSTYEAIHFDVASGQRLCRTSALVDEAWDTYTTLVGWGVQGIWEGRSDGSDIMCVSRDPSQTLLVAGLHSAQLRLFNYPCLMRQCTDGQALKAPHSHHLAGHGGPVMRALFTSDGQHLVSVGGPDLAVIQWRVARWPLADPGGSTGGAVQRKGIDEEDVDSMPMAARVRLGLIHEIDSSAPQRPPRHGTPERSATSPHARGMPSRTRSASARAPPSAGSAPNYDHVTSKLLSMTSSMLEKAKHGKAQRDHHKRIEEARRHFNTVV